MSQRPNAEMQAFNDTLDHLLADPNGPPQFDNVFVRPSAYHDYLKTGRWPEKTMFVLEVRRALTEGSINKGGQFQGDIIGVEVE